MCIKWSLYTAYWSSFVNTLNPTWKIDYVKVFLKRQQSLIYLRLSYYIYSVHSVVDSGKNLEKNLNEEKKQTVDQYFVNKYATKVRFYTKWFLKERLGGIWIFLLLLYTIQCIYIFLFTLSQSKKNTKKKRRNEKQDVLNSVLVGKKVDRRGNELKM